MKVPLVRVEGKSYTLRPDLSFTAAGFLDKEKLDREARDQVARDAEAHYRLGGCLYFYAGYACPGFGDIVLAYDPKISHNCDGSASSFDSGGLYKGFINGHGLKTDDDRMRLFTGDVCVLGDWQRRAEVWIKEHFGSLDRYIRSNEFERAAQDDWTGRMQHPSNDRRAWTYEVRLHTDVPIYENLIFAVVRQDFWHSAMLHGSAERKKMLMEMYRAGVFELAFFRDPCIIAVDLACKHSEGW